MNILSLVFMQMNNPMTKKITLKSFLLVFMLFTVACSSKLHVRLFTANLSPEDSAKIEEKFRSSKLLYSTTTAPFPKSIVTNAIIYNPLIGSNDKVYHVMDVLESADFHISWTSMIKVENHSFTPNNIGLYLFSEGYESNRNEKPTLEINEYGSVDCGSQLVLHEDLTFTVVFDIWDYKLEDYREESVVGFWKEQNSTIVVLYSEAWHAELGFEKTINIELRNGGSYTIISLLPMLNSVEDDFYLKEHGSQPSVNCIYRTHLIN